MDVARTAVSIMGLEDKETTDSSQEANTRKVLRMAWTTKADHANTYRDVNHLKKHETASGQDYARFKRERATLKNYNDSKH